MTGVKQEFFQGLLDKMHKEKLPLFQDVSARNENALYTYRGGFGYQFNIRKKSVFIRFFVDDRSDTAEKNKILFDRILKHKPEIEALMGCHLDSDSRNNVRVCYLTKKIQPGYDDKDWDKLQDKMIAEMRGLELATRGILAK